MWNDKLPAALGAKPLTTAFIVDLVLEAAIDFQPGGAAEHVKHGIFPHDLLLGLHVAADDRLPLRLWDGRLAFLEFNYHLALLCKFGLLLLHDHRVEGGAS